PTWRGAVRSTPATSRTRSTSSAPCSARGTTPIHERPNLPPPRRQRSKPPNRFPGTSFVECGKTVAVLQAIADSSHKREEETDAAKVACDPIDSGVVACWLRRFKARGLI